MKDTDPRDTFFAFASWRAGGVKIRTGDVRRNAPRASAPHPPAVALCFDDCLTCTSIPRMKRRTQFSRFSRRDESASRSRVASNLARDALGDDRTPG